MAVNYHELYNDSKTFVDMPMKNDPEYILDKFNDEFGSVSVENINRTLLKIFLEENFSPPGSEMMSCTPPDWNPQPAKLMSIVDPHLREWALKLNAIDPKIEETSSRHSLLFMPHMFIIPGGRFREFYYWDAYWIIKGLIASEMYDTTKAMIENLGSMVERFGFVPNGGRVYYLRRSQPPLLAGMVYEYYEVTKDKEFIRKMLPILEKELLFWQTNRMVNVTVNGTTYMAYRYNTMSNMPRPESFAVDVLPVDLNAFICWNYDILEYLFERIDDQVKSEFYREVRAKFRNTVHKVFYNHTAGTWYDFNLRTGAHNTGFYPSITVPLFTGCYNSLNQGKSERLFLLMKDLGVFDFPGGIPTSMVKDSEEQWDFPNGFSPLNHMVVEGLRKSQNAQMQDAGYRLARKWLAGNFKVWKETNHMWEKMLKN
ncbi:unnamed protein product [Nippostrongylus brasiliensis]|uniref:Trehalase n=1 Tax=Nippostrongylus brasiliensis TaxID=27835 RepID=A0A0N4Y2K1_NIPBR|nr:unnamed protein product [Nippostrongylus brasiliensis]